MESKDFLYALGIMCSGYILGPIIQKELPEMLALVSQIGFNNLTITFLVASLVCWLFGFLVLSWVSASLFFFLPSMNAGIKQDFNGLLLMFLGFLGGFLLIYLFPKFFTRRQNITNEEYQDESQSTTNEDMDFAQKAGLKSHNKQRATNSANVEAILERCRQKLETIEWSKVNIKAMMEDLFHKEWDISGGFGHTRQEAVVLGKSIINFVGFEYSFVEHRTFAEYFVFQEMENKLVGYRFQRIEQRLYHGENGKHYDQIIISVSATPLSEFKKLGLDFSDGINEPELYKLQDSHKVEVINFEVVCWFDITNHFGKDGPPFL